MDARNARDAGRAVPQAGAAMPGVRTRAVVALVRPLAPNTAVLARAADLAGTHGAALLVLGTVEPRMSDWVEGIDVAGPVIRAAHAELFATCVEQLWDRPVPWGVSVLWGRVAPEVVRLGERVDVLTVVRGNRSPDTALRRLRRRVSGRLDDALVSIRVQSV